MSQGIPAPVPYEVWVVGARPTAITDQPLAKWLWGIDPDILIHDRALLGPHVLELNPVGFAAWDGVPSWAARYDDHRITTDSHHTRGLHATPEAPPTPGPDPPA